MVDLRCETLSGAGGDKCSCACYLALSVICSSVRLGGTPRRGRQLSACGRKGSKEWRNWELWSICWSQKSPVPARCRIVAGSQRQEGSTAERKKEKLLKLVFVLWPHGGSTTSFEILTTSNENNLTKSQDDRRKNRFNFKLFAQNVINASPSPFPLTAEF